MSQRHMIIFNQQEFDNRDMFREGSDEDVKSLQRTFANFGIKPAERKDFKLKQIQQEVKILSTADFTGCQLFMCVILSHGNGKQLVWAKDKKFHSRRTIIDPIIKNKSLNGVVKIFIVAACRGSAELYKTSDHWSEIDGCILSKKGDVDHSNVLICYSTVEGHVSWRNTERGTYYIYELCKLIDEKGLHLDFYSLLTDLNNTLIERGKQVAIFESTLRKPIFLKYFLATSYDNIPTSSNCITTPLTAMKVKISDHITTPSRPKTIVICGQRSVGKSTLGNLIVQAINPDENSPSPFEMPSPIAENVVKIVKNDEFDVNVIDTPGFRDTEGEELNPMNVCNISRALEADNVVAVLFVVAATFNITTKIWYNRFLKTIPIQHQGNVFIVHTQFSRNESSSIHKQIKMLVGNEFPDGKVSLLPNCVDVIDYKKTILNLFNEWTRHYR